MTTEIAVMNKGAIALAADSAVTVGRGNKFYNTVNKLFALSKYNPVGIMVYGNAEFMGYPIETVIKDYREKLGNTTYKNLNDYWDDFIKYLLDNFSNIDHKRFYYSNIETLLIDIDAYINREMDELIEDSAGMTKEDIEKNINNVLYNSIGNIHRDFLSFPNDKNFIDLYNIIKEDIRIEAESLVQKIIGILPEDLNKKLIEICTMILTKEHNLGIRTGIVIAGYGEDELYPGLISGEFMGIYNNRVKYNSKHNSKITFENNATIIPFGQDDVIATFMNGIDITILQDILNTVEAYKEFISNNGNCGCSNDKCLDALQDEIREIVRISSSHNHWGPIIDTVSVAPKEELAQMAETLVNLTSFRRKLSMDLYSQSVGGPIDVALITKGDGFIWIKRKFYFDKDLNYNFFANYHK